MLSGRCFLQGPACRHHHTCPGCFPQSLRVSRARGFAVRNSNPVWRQNSVFKFPRARQNRCRASNSGGEGGSAELDVLLEALLPSSDRGESSQSPGEAIGPEWLEKVQKQGRTLAAEVEKLRQSVVDKHAELEDVKEEWVNTARELSEAHELLAACQGELEVKTAEVEVLREELENVQATREADSRATLARYRELEEALALAQKELEDRPSDIERDGSSQDELDRLGGLVADQDKVLSELYSALESAKEAKSESEQEVERLQSLATKHEQSLVDLQEKYGELEAVFQDAKSALEEGEGVWNKRLKEIEAGELAAIEEASVARQELKEREEKVSQIETQLEALKSKHSEQIQLCKSLEGKCSELEAKNVALTEAMDGADAVAEEGAIELKAYVGALESQVESLRQGMEQMERELKQNDSEKQAAAVALKKQGALVGRLENLLETVQSRLEQKSRSLGASNKEKRANKSEARKIGREVKRLSTQMDGLNARLKKSNDSAKGLKVELEGSKSQRDVLKVNLAQVQQELETALLKEAERKVEVGEMQAKIVQLRTKLLKSEQGIKQVPELGDLQVELEKAQKFSSQAADELDRAESREKELREQLGLLEEEFAKSKEENGKLIAKLEADAQGVSGRLVEKESALNSAQREIQNLRKSVQERDGRLYASELKLSGLGSDQESIVSTLKTELEEAWRISQGKGKELADAAGVISQLTQQMELLQSALEDRNLELDKVKSDVSQQSSNPSKDTATEITSLKRTLTDQQEVLAASLSEREELEQQVESFKELAGGQAKELEEAKRKLAEEQEQSENLRIAVEQSEAALVDLKKKASKEMEEASRLLEKAESVARAVVQGIESEQTQAQGSGPGTPTGQEEDESSVEGDFEGSEELIEQVSELESALEEQTLVAADAVDRADMLEEEVRCLEVELQKIQERAASQTVVEESSSEEASKQEQLSQALAAESAARAELHELRQRVKELELNEETSLSELLTDIRSAGSNDQRMDILLEHAEKLEEENVRLRHVAVKRNQILAQSRRFIEQYLERSMSLLSEK